MMLAKAIVFDLYGTLYDVHTVAQRCDDYHPGRGMDMSVMWRQKQLEYTWLRTLMGQYIPFEDATRDALAYTCERLGLPLGEADRATLSEAYLQLAPYPEVPAALQRLQATGLPLAILSNGSAFSIGQVVDGSGLRAHFAHLLSVESVGVFKPHGKVYELACRTLALPAQQIVFVSSNAWDAAGAAHFGFQVCWVNRTDSPFDELGTKPRMMIRRLDELPDLLAG
jgi:2-haloacid dehalogenase